MQSIGKQVWKGAEKAASIYREKIFIALKIKA